MGEAARKSGVEASGAGRVIGPEEWPRQRFAWLSAVRSDRGLTMTDKLVAHALALDFANYNTLQCDPSYRQVAVACGTSEKSVQRAVLALVEGGWIARRAGSGRGRRSAYIFLSRAQIVRFKRPPADPRKVDKNDPLKVDSRDHLSGSERWTKTTVKVDKNASAYNKAKPYKNHEARAGADGAISDTVLGWAEMIRQGDGSMARFLGRHDIRNLLDAGLVSADQLRRVGVDPELG